MIKWAIALVAAIYIVMLVIPDEPDASDVAESQETGGTDDSGSTTLTSFFSDIITQAEDGASRPSAPADRFTGDDIALREDNGSYQLETTDGEVLDVVAVINPFEAVVSDEDDRSIARVTLGDAAAEPRVAEAAPNNAAAEVTPEATPTPTAAAETTSALWRVTGDRVNFRAGPSTDDAILTALVRGDQVEYLEDAPDDWARLRVVATGIEGFMALEFLEPVTN